MNYNYYMAVTFCSQFVVWEYNGELVPGSSFIKVGKLVTTAIQFQCQWDNGTNISFNYQPQHGWPGDGF